MIIQRKKDRDKNNYRKKEGKKKNQPIKIGTMASLIASFLGSFHSAWGLMFIASGPEERKTELMRGWETSSGLRLTMERNGALVLQISRSIVGGIGVCATLAKPQSSR